MSIYFNSLLKKNIIQKNKVELSSSHLSKKHTTFLIATFFTIILTACGGGGGDETTPKASLDTPLTSPKLLDASLTGKTKQSLSLSVPSSEGKISQCLINPTLPSGLEIIQSSNACTVSGNVQMVVDNKNYTITAINSLGQSQSKLNINISSSLVAPLLSNVTTNIKANQVFTAQFLNSGGAVSKCTVTPNLPAGVSITEVDASCQINGTYTSVLANQIYTVNANNSVGSANATFTLSVSATLIQPDLEDTSYMHDYSQAVNILVPNTGGAVASCSSNPQLPSTLSLTAKANGCLISGNHNAVLNTPYNITATNASGSDTSLFTLELTKPLTAPVLANTTPTEYLTGEVISLVINNNGGDIAECTINPTLPSELSLTKSKSNCTLSGTSSVPLNKTYTLAATNPAGVSQTTIGLIINQAPSKPKLSSASEYNFNQDQYKKITLVNSAGDATRCVTIPNLPAGLYISPSDNTCAIEGSPIESSPKANYQILGSNTVGESTVNFNLSVIAKTQSTWGAGPNPTKFDYITRMIENDFDAANPPALLNEVDDAVLELDASSAVNKITSITLDSNKKIETEAEIAKFFTLLINPQTGKLSLHNAKSFNYESDSKFYELKVQLGSVNKTILVRLYDIQNGNAAEPLKLDSYKEFKSFAQGTFISDSDFPRFEVVTIDTPKAHNIAGLEVQLGADIDASASQTTPFLRFDFAGHLDGKRHVITNLNAPDGILNIINFGKSPTKYDVGDFSIFKSVGFVDLKSQSRTSLIRDNDTVGANTKLNHISISGYLTSSLGSGTGDAAYANRLNYHPLALSRTELQSVYINMHHLATDGISSSVSGKAGQTSGLLSTLGSSSSISHVYVNGSMRTQNQTSDIRVNANCLSSYQVIGNVDNFYCAKEYDISVNQATRSPRIIGHFQNNYSGFGLHYLDDDGSQTNSKFRFINNRGNNATPRNAGNGYADRNNDGIVDDASVERQCTVLDKSPCHSYAEYGRSESQFKEEIQWSGSWKSSNRWDIAEGEFPVLKDMPYPHKVNAPWVYQKDPGVAYQRYTYNDYLEATKPSISTKPLPIAPEIKDIKLADMQNQVAVDLLIPVDSGLVTSCYANQKLPSGLELKLDEEGCRLVGTPNIDRLDQIITIIAANAGGASAIKLHFNILPQLPKLKSRAALSVRQGEVLNVEFLNQGGKVTACYMSPLPNGLNIQVSENGCLLSGSALQAQPTQSYQISANNDSGNHSIHFNLTVNAPLGIPALSGDNTLSWLQGDVVEASFTNSSDNIESCTISPELPRGLRLRLDKINDKCIIEGTPLEDISATDFVINATNTGGSGTFNLNLTIVAQVWVGAGPSPYSFNLVGAIRENILVSGSNDFSSANPDVILSEIDSPDALVMQTLGFPNKITNIEFEDNSSLASETEIDKLFTLVKSPTNNEVRIFKNKAYDFENDEHFYKLSIQLGTQTKKVLVRLYDIQTGESHEPILMHTYEEFKSFGAGDFQLDTDLFELFEPYKNQAHNIAGFHYNLGGDIDASISEFDKLPRISFRGVLDGKKYVIKNLHLKEGLLSAHSYNKNDTADVNIKNIGFVDLHAYHVHNNLISISDNGRNSYLTNVFIEGYVEKDLGTIGGPYNGIYYSPLTLSGVYVKQFYLNIYNDLKNGYTAGGQHIVNISGFVSKGSGGAYFDNVYVNGATVTRRQTGAVNLQANCLTSTEGVFWGIGPIYCSQEYRVTNHADLAKNGDAFRRRTPTVVSMLMPTYFTYSHDDTQDQPEQHNNLPFNKLKTDSKYRFVTDRNYEAGKIKRTVGNGYRDFLNNGVADDVLFADYPAEFSHQWTQAIYDHTKRNCTSATECYKMDKLGRTTVDFKSSDSWSGAWKDNGKWDITDTQWPVLKDMPYPHDEDASWMLATDPGVAYQRATYDKYLEDNR